MTNVVDGFVLWSVHDGSGAQCSKVERTCGLLDCPPISIRFPHQGKQQNMRLTE